MFVMKASQTGTGSAEVDKKPLPALPFHIGFGVVASGTVNYTVEHTFDGTNWFPHDAVAAIDDVDSDGNYAFPVANIRVTVNSGTGSASLTAIQAK
jgi:hypothetical protein